MTRLVDLDDVAGLERAWRELEALREARAADPELRSACLRTLDAAEAAGRIDSGRRSVLAAELERQHPEVWLDSHYLGVVPPRVTVGRIRREWGHRPPDARDLLAELRDDPTRLRLVVAEASRFTSDWERVVEGVLELADRARIPAAVADAEVAGAVRALRGGRRAG